MLIEKQFDRIFLTGDKHGDFFDLVKDSNRYGLSNKDLLIILGDVGVNYFGTAFFSRNDNHAKTQLSQIPCTILCVHGNHELRPTSKEIKGKYRRIEWMAGQAYKTTIYFFT